MLDLDGGDGGGQVVRTATALSALTGNAVRIEAVRGDRPEPGMKPQHVAAVEAAAALCDGAVEGVEPGADTLEFRPGEVRAADVSVDVGTAGSVALVVDTLLPLATALDGPASVTVTGGTDVAWAPPLDYLAHVKLPLLRAVGLDADLSVARRGFYPLGGGTATLSLRPSSLDPIELVDRGALRRVEVRSVAAADLADAEVAERQATAVADGLDAAVPVGTDASYDETACPGSVVTISGVYEGSRAGGSALGERGKPSEDVASDALAAFERFHDGPAAVDRHLADQLQVPLALAGGRVSAPTVTTHLETNRDVIAAFGHDVELEALDDRVLIRG